MNGAFEEKLFFCEDVLLSRGESLMSQPHAVTILPACCSSHCAHSPPCYLLSSHHCPGWLPRSVIVSPVPVTPQSSVTKSRMWCVTICVTMAAIHLTMSFVVDQLGAWRRQPFPPVRSLQTINYLKTFKTLLHLAPKQYLGSPRSGSFCQQESKKPQNCFKGNVSEYCS